MIKTYLENLPFQIFAYVGAGIFLFIILNKFFPKLFLKIHKPIFFTIAVLSLSLGYIGIIIPGLPTTVFILIAAWAFSKCSTRFTYWIENHKIFGPMILNWQKYKGLSRKAKKFAILSIISSYTLTIYLVFSTVGDLIFGLSGVILCVWLATRPEPPLEISN